MDIEPGNGFLQSTRHHGHYFSNIDLFIDSGFNYLKYAKYLELQKSPEPLNTSLWLRNVTLSVDLRSFWDRFLLRLPRRVETLKNINLQLTSGDILALLYSNESEMQTFLRLLSGSHIATAKLKGDIRVNGHRYSQNELGRKVAFVSRSSLPATLTVSQYLRIESASTVSMKTGAERTKMINQLLVTLALTPYRNSMCREIGDAERQRVRVAAALLKDTDILVCDNICQSMDVYESAFIIDYLREWAMKLDKIVVFAQSPPTIEILEMFSHVAILASGRFTYCGPPTEMISYFESVNFPCPLFKNPCDYYVDLVTHDHLSPSASLESSTRIDTLSELWAERQENSRLNIPAVSRIGRFSKSIGCFRAVLLFYSYNWMLCVNRPIPILREPLLCLIISLLTSVFYMPLNLETRSGINDRFGIVSSITTYSMLPCMLMWISLAQTQSPNILPDHHILRGLANLLFLLPLHLMSCLCFTGPIFWLSGLFSQSTSPMEGYFYFYITIFIFISIWKSIAYFISKLLTNYTTSLTVVGSVFLISYVSSGIPMSTGQMTSFVQIGRLLSPHYWAGNLLLYQEFMGSSLIGSMIQRQNISELIIGCERKKILARKVADVPIYTVSFCSKFRGAQVLAFHGFDPEFLIENQTLTSYFYLGAIVLSVWSVISWLCLICIVVCKKR